MLLICSIVPVALLLLSSLHYIQPSSGFLIVDRRYPFISRNFNSQVTTATPSSSFTMSLSGTAVRHTVRKLKPENTVFLLCDIQEQFCPLIYRGETII
jgi:hypothetical protein